MRDKKETILAVDDNPMNLNLLFDLLDTAGYKIFFAQDGERAVHTAVNVSPDLILLDIMMPGIDGFETCRQLKSNAETKEIPIIFMSALSDTVDKLKGFDVGAVDYITKPFHGEEVLARVRTHLTLQNLQNELKEKNRLLGDREVHLTKLVEEKTQKIENITLTLVNALENANALNDDDTGKHIKRVGEYSALLAEKYGCDREFIKKIKLFAPLHDVGKVGLPDTLLKKAGRYSREEAILMQEHVVFGSRLLSGEAIDEMAHNIVSYHHEKWDGTGYVKGLQKEEIPLEARIVAIADVFDALMSKRVYKEAFEYSEVIKIIKESSGSHFDPELVTLFLDNQEELYDIFENMKWEG
jgi:putative two-component system response regulator